MPSEIKNNDIELDRYISQLSSDYQLNHKILLVNPPQFVINKFDMNKAEAKGYYAYPPTGLLFLAANLDSFGVDVRIADLNFEVLKASLNRHRYDENLWREILCQHIDQYKPSVIGVSCMYSYLSSEYEIVLSDLMERNEGSLVIRVENKSLINQ